MSIIILEGPDGVGKSTLANALVRDRADGGAFMAGAIKHTQQPDPAGPGAYHEYLDELTDMWRSDVRLNPDVVVVYDRFHLGEIVYGPIMRGSSDFSHHTAKWIDKKLAEMGVILVLLDAPDPVILRRSFEDRGEDFVDTDQLTMVASEYRKVGGIEWHNYDTDHHSTDDICAEIWRITRTTTVREMFRA